MASITIFERWVVEAYLAVNPNHPRWTRVANHAVGGYREIMPLTTKLGETGAHHYADSLAFDSAEKANQAWDIIRRNKQDHNLRIVKTAVIVIEPEVFQGPMSRY